MQDGYRTLKAPGASEFIIKKSRFIGYGSPAETETDALAFLAQIRRRHKDATHNCWAYVIGRNAGIMRYSDDGEPGGTAGLPMMEVIKAREVKNCCVVVTRYFGGVLLGAGGLVRAYSQGASAALDAAGVIMMEDTVRFWAGMAYPLWGRVEHALGGLPVIREDTEFAATVTATLLVRARDKDNVFAELTRVTDGQVDLMALDTLSYGWDTARGNAE